MSGPALPPSLNNPYQRYVDTVMESCVTKAIASGVMGFGLGAAMGTFTMGFEVAGLDNKNTVREAFKQMGQRTYSLGKNFGTVGLVFAGVECAIEKSRAKHDMWNGLSAGCATGAMFAAKSGPKAMVSGCAGFAAFSLIIDRVMER